MVPRGSLVNLLSEVTMAILKALTKIQREKIEAAKPVKIPRAVPACDAHVQAYRDHLVANFAGKVEVLPVGKQLRATHWWQGDYRSFTPKGTTLVNPKLTGVHGRFAVK
jgi:hypothetical protein